MDRRKFLKLAGMGASLPASLPGVADTGDPVQTDSLEPNKPRSPFDVGSRAQLFIDQVLVRDTERVAFTLHPAEKHPKNPLVKADRPRERWH
jgi:hypothetical protein